MKRSNPDGIDAALAGVAQARSQLERVAQELAALTGGSLNDSGRHDFVDLTSLAKGLYNERRVRDAFIEPETFAEPGWDILLFLYIDYLEDRTSITSEVQRASQTGPATYRRWLDKLCAFGLVKKSPTDGREVFVSLTDKAVGQMTSLLTNMNERRIRGPVV